MAEIEIRIRLAIDAASQSAVLPIYVVSTPKTLDERVTFAQSSQPSQAEKSSRACFKATLSGCNGEKPSTQNRLKRPQIRKAAVLPGEASREIWQEESGKREMEGEGEDCYRSACRRCRRRCSGNGNVEQPPQWVGYTQRHSPRGLGWNCWNCSLLSESMTQCVFLMEALFGCKGLRKCATIKLTHEKLKATASLSFHKLPHLSPHLADQDT